MSFFLRDHEVTASQENISVQPLTLTKETCLHLILLLIESTNTVAPSLRDVDGFKVHLIREVFVCSITKIKMELQFKKKRKKN